MPLNVSSQKLHFLKFDSFKVKHLFNERKSKAAIVLVWVSGISIAMPFLLMAEYTTEPAMQCNLNMTKAHLFYVCVLNIMLIFVPTLGMAFLYIHITIKLKEHYKLFACSTPSRSNSLQLHSTIKKESTSCSPLVNQAISMQQPTSTATTLVAAATENGHAIISECSILRMHRNDAKLHQPALNRNQ